MATQGAQKLWKVGDTCRVLSTNGRWYTAVIHQIEPAESVAVKFVGYEQYDAKSIPLSRVLPLEPPQDVGQWSTDQVCDWLILQGPPLASLSRYFSSAWITGEKLIKMSLEDVLALGVPEDLAAMAYDAITGVLTSQNTRNNGSRRRKSPAVAHAENLVSSSATDTMATTGLPPSPQPPRRDLDAPTSPSVERTPSDAKRRRSVRFSMVEPAHDSGRKDDDYAKENGEQDDSPDEVASVSKRDRDKDKFKRRASMQPTPFSNVDPRSNPLFHPASARSSQASANQGMATTAFPTQQIPHAIKRSISKERWSMAFSRWGAISAITSREQTGGRERSKSLTITRRRAMLKDSDFDRVADLTGADDDDRPGMIRTHQFLLDQAKSQDSGMQNKLALIRQEKRLLTQEMAKLSAWERIKFAFDARKRSAFKSMSVITQWGLWAKTLKQINGLYGSSLWQFFAFMRWLFVFNLVMAILWLALVVIPAAASDKEVPIITNVTSGNGCLTSYEIVVNGTRGPDYTGFGASNAGAFFAGAGGWEHSLLFYGGYAPYKIGSYDLPVAYFLLLPATILFCLFLLVRSIALSIRQNALFADGSTPHPFGELVLASWDHSLEDFQTKKLNQGAITHGIRQLIETDLVNEKVIRRERKKVLCTVEPRHRTVRLLLRCMTTVSLFTVVGVVCFYLHKFILNNYEDFNEDPDVAEDLGPPAVVTLILIFVPTITMPISAFEYWQDPTFELWFRIFRNVLAYIFIVGTYFASFMYVLSPENVDCWPTRTGQEFYRLLMLDFFIRTTLSMIAPVLWRALFFMKLVESKAPQFDVPSNTLGTLYRQAIIWTGLPVCPMMPVLGTIVFLVDFHFRKYFLFWTCVPPSRPYRISIATFKRYLLITLLLSTVASCFMIFARPPGTCGPFIGFHRIYCVVSVRINDGPQWFNDVWDFIFTAGVSVPVLLLLFLAGLYLRARIGTKTKTIARLKQHLIRDMADIRVLLRLHDAQFSTQTL